MRKPLIALLLTTLFVSSAFALTPAKRSKYLSGLTADERAKYESVLNSSGQAAADKFLATREFTHQCQAVREGSLPPLLLPPFPSGDFVVDYLDDEEKPVVLFALKRSTEELEKSCRASTPPTFPPV